MGFLATPIFYTTLKSQILVNKDSLLLSNIFHSKNKRDNLSIFLSHALKCLAACIHENLKLENENYKIKVACKNMTVRKAIIFR